MCTLYFSVEQTKRATPMNVDLQLALLFLKKLKNACADGECFVAEGFPQSNGSKDWSIMMEAAFSPENDRKRHDLKTFHATDGNGRFHRDETN